jgi:D-sedoheptulose 7-phosphate isomerase
MNINDWIKKYLEKQVEVISSIPIDKVADIIEEFIKANKDKKQIFVFGNGGSASNASHFTTDLAKGASDVLKNKFKCISLNECTSLITAIANDYDYEDIFVKQLENFANPNDIVLTMSVSGTSPNLVKAVEWANKKELYTIALVGGKQGILTRMADKVIVVNSSHYGVVEDMHMMICHMIAYAFIENTELTQ